MGSGQRFLMDIAGELEKIFVGFNDFGSEPFLKKVADEIVFGLKITDVADKESLDKFGNWQFGGLVKKEVKMIRHKAVGKNFDEIFFLIFFHFFSESGVIGIIFKDIPPLVPAGINVVVVVTSVVLVERHNYLVKS